MNTSPLVNMGAIAFPPALTIQQRTLADLLALSSTPGHWRPDMLMTLDRQLMDKLLAGEVLTDNEEGEIVMWTEWSQDLLGAMEWWADVSCCALEELFERHHDEADIDRRLGEREALEVAAFVALARARKGHCKDLMPGVQCSSEPESRELARRYGLYVRYVEALLFEVWPDMNRELVLNPQPEWAHKKRVQ